MVGANLYHQAMNTLDTNLHDPVKHFRTIFHILVCVRGQPNKDGENVIELR